MSAQPSRIFPTPMTAVVSLRSRLNRARIVGFGFSFLAASASHAAVTSAAATPKISAADLEFFENRVRPVLVESCYKCHSRDSDKVKGGLMLDSREALLHGGSSGDALVPGNPDKSLIIQAIRYTDEDLQMPPKGNKLSAQQIADLTEWVRRGAPDPRALAAKGSSPAYAGVGREHWSFLPIKKPAVPVVANQAWCQTPIDNFILDKLQENKLAPNAAADKRTLIRRVTFDLIGLPPTEAEVNAFVADTSPGAYGTVVDRLLASPQYGERWGRYWLDVARYADTKGDPAKREDNRFPHAWTYRDYVINAFNSDKPFNQFILEQIAADRVVLQQIDAAKKANKDVKFPDQSAVAALGFLTLGNQFDGNIHDIINDRIDVTTKAFLGLTVSCARCHDHKFDPIPTKDYYSLYNIFANTFEPKSMLQEPTVHPYLKSSPEYQAYLAKLEDAEAKKKKLAADYIEFRRGKTNDRDVKKELQKRDIQIERELADIESDPGAPARAYVLVDLPRIKIKDYPVLVRGEAQNKGELTQRHFLSILAGPKPPVYKDGSGRLDLAKDIASPNNPLTARVLVNRIWQEHFGSGFVATPDDLGNMSSPPTHPELLDYLASRFMEDGWSIKKLHRLIVMSAVYQESSAPNEQYADLDPSNKLLWRYNLRRLDFEQVHDSLLAIAGTLDLKMGGKSIQIGSTDFASRRAVYTYIDRRNPAEILTQFDFPNPSVPTGRRYETIVPQQSLFLMNSPLVIETARKLTHRPNFATLPTDEARVASLYLAVFQRPPTPQEVQLSLHYVTSNPGGTSTEAPVARAANADASNRAAQRQARVAELAAKGSFGKNAPQVEPAAAAFKSRAPLDAWTKLAHALFQTNEAMFFN